MIKSLLSRLTLDPSVSLDHAWKALELEGIEILYGSEDEGNLEFFVYLPKIEVLSSFSWIKACEPYSLPPIDWQAQWAEHAPNFEEGFLVFDPAMWGRQGKSFQLMPGGGFGDLSHPTTRLILQLMAKHLKNEIVIDIGCGSGILSLAGLAMGSKAAFGIDIDHQAVLHSSQNAKLNGVGSQYLIFMPDEFIWSPLEEEMLILMNMIRTEQLFAWSSLPSLHNQKGKLLTSGVRIEEREVYIEEISKLGWSLKEENEEMGWLGFCFVKNSLYEKKSNT